MKPRARPSSAAPRALRIIGGTHRRSLLPVADAPGLRPTPDRVRETLFNWLGQDLSQWRCIDAFAGSGALGFEAASRGAQEVMMVEPAAQLVRSLRACADRLKFSTVRVVAGDALSQLQQARGQAWDLVFLDPPFTRPEWVQPALEAAHDATGDGGLCYLESDRDWPDSTWAETGWRLAKSARAAAVHYCLLDKA